MTPAQYAKAGPAVRAAYAAGLSGGDLVAIVSAFEDGRRSGEELRGAVWIGAEGFIFRTSAVTVHDGVPLVPFKPLVTSEQLGISVPSRPGHFCLEDLAESWRVMGELEEPIGSAKHPGSIVRWTVETLSPAAALIDPWTAPEPLLALMRRTADSGLDWRPVSTLEIGQWVIVPRNQRDTDGIVVRRCS